MNKVIKVFLVISLVAILFTSFACASSSSSSRVPEEGRTFSVPAIAPAAPQVDSAGNVAVSKEYAGGSGYALEVDRKIVKTGNITLVVGNIGDSIEAISKLATDFGGYVVNASKHETDNGQGGEISIRVPANRYDEALSSLRQMAEKVPYENTSSQDVTEEYVDLQAKLKNLEASEAQYLVLMNKAQTVEDMIKIQDALSNVRAQIDSIKGRIQYLDRTTDMSLIYISLQETQRIQSKSWNPGETIKSALNGLITFGKVLVDVIIWLLFFGWWAIVIVIVVVVLVRRKKKKAKAAQEIK